MTDLNPEHVAKAADVLDVRVHEYRRPQRTPCCICGWSATEEYDVAAYDRHIAIAVLEAVADDLRAEGAERALVDADEHLARAAFAVDSKHHIHGTTCLCGFEGNARKRTQTEHITAAVIEEYNRDRHPTRTDRQVR